MKKVWQKVLPMISPGIRLQLTLFTIFFVSALIVASFVFSYFSQKADLEESFRKEVRVPEEVVSAHVGDLHRFAQGFVQLETFRIRLKEKTAAARALRKAVQVREKSLGNTWRSFVKTFGARVQYSYQTRRFDTYYSTYLTEKNLKDFENQLLSAVAASLPRAPDKVVIEGWKKTAARVAEAEIAAALLEENLSGKRDEQELERKRAQIAKNRTLLMSDLSRVFDPYLQAKLDRMQFERQTIRILSYGTELENLSAEVEAGKGGKKLKMPGPLLDTGMRAVADTAESWALLRSGEFSDYVRRVFTEPDEYFHSTGELGGKRGREIRLARSSLEVRFAPVPMQLPVVERARLASAAEKDAPDFLQKFIAEDSRFAAELKLLAAKKSQRLDVLREKGTPPYKDADYMAAAREYRALVAQRDAALREIVHFAALEKEQATQKLARLKERETVLAQTTKQIKELTALLQLAAKGKAPKETPSVSELERSIELARQQSEAERGEIAALKAQAGSYEPGAADGAADRERAQKLMLAEALLNLRDAALYGRIRLALVSEQDLLRQQRRNPAARNEQLRHFAAVRQFIYEAKNETDIPVARGATSPLAGGVLAITRSEAEEQMHDLDTRPLLGDKGLVRILLNENIAGYNMIVVDKTSGLARIWNSTQRLLWFSSGIALLAVLAAWYFSGLAVRRIASLSSTSQQVRNGNLNVSFADRGYDELSSLGQSLNSMVEGLREREELRGELMAAEEIQKRLLPASVPVNLKGRADIAGFYKAMVGIGGDYFDYVPIGSDYIAIAMGDVSNHGVGPALVMAITRSQLHAELRAKELSVRSILLKLNEQLYAETPANIFVTFFLALYNLKTGEMQYASAGHSKPLLYRAAGGKTSYLEAGGMPLGMDDNDFFADTLEIRKVKLEPGDIFVQYTDGLSEAMNAAREQFGYDRMSEQLVRNAAQPAEGVLTGLSRAVEQFTGTRLDQPGPSALNDDIALVCLRRTAV
ncbi:MAG TPA: SpoIIE family protein phosphatase [Turneriella sp.]|nr:SpoIIE family protein phosphatase [Turneriella sp.]